MVLWSLHLQAFLGLPSLIDIDQSTRVEASLVQIVGDIPLSDKLAAGSFLDHKLPDPFFNQLLPYRLDRAHVKKLIFWSSEPLVEGLPLTVFLFFLLRLLFRALFDCNFSFSLFDFLLDNFLSLDEFLVGFLVYC